MKPTLLNSNRHLNNLLSIIVCLGSLLFAENLEVTLKTGECYTGCLKSYSNAGIHLVTDSGNKEIVAITYRSIEKIVYENITLFTPVDLNDIKNIIKNKELNLIDSKSKDSQKAEKDTISQRVKLPPCYDDLFLYNKMKNLDAMSDSAFQHIVSLHHTIQTAPFPVSGVYRFQQYPWQSLWQGSLRAVNLSHAILR